MQLLAFSFTPSLVSDQQGTICTEKRVKQWRHQGSYKQRAIRLPFGRANNAINILVLGHVQNYKRGQSHVRSSPHYITFLDICLWNNKNFFLCVIYLLISLLFFFLSRYYCTCLHCVKNILWPVWGVNTKRFVNLAPDIRVILIYHLNM